MSIKKTIALFTSMALSLSMLTIDCSAVADSKDIDNSQVNLSICTFTSVSPTTAKAYGYMKQRKANDSAKYSVASFLYCKGHSSYIAFSGYTNSVSLSKDNYLHSYYATHVKEESSENYASRLQLTRNNLPYDSVGPLYK